MRILAVDGDENCLCSLEIGLGAERFTVYGTDSGEEAISLGKLYDYDAIVLSETLDVHVDTVIRTLRNNKVRTPILVVSGARGAITNGHDLAIPALDLGADDWMAKPAYFPEVAARLNALVRRSRGHDTPIVTVGPLAVNLSTKMATVNGKVMHLTGKEFGMLELLALRQGMTITKEMFLNHLYGGMDEPEMKIIDVFICKLRRKLDAVGAADLVQTIWGRGYVLALPIDYAPKMVAEVREIISEPPVYVGSRTVAEAEAVSSKKRFGAVA